MNPTEAEATNITKRDAQFAHSVARIHNTVLLGNTTVVHIVCKLLYSKYD